MNIKPPLLLDGDLESAFALSPTGEESVQQWMLRNPDQVAGLQREFVRAGAQALRAPTGGLSALELAGYPDAPDSRKLNYAMVAITNLAANGAVPVAGVIRSVGYQPEPFGPLPYTDLVDAYAQQALELADGGAKLLVLQGMRTIQDARAAVLGARQSGLPLLVSLDSEADGSVQPGATDSLAVMLCLQELGISAFGICHGEADKLVQGLQRLAPYAKVPLLAHLKAGSDTPEQLALSAFDALSGGARILLGGEGVTPAHTAQLRKMLDGFDFDAIPLPERSGDTPLLLADGLRVYYLEEDFNTSAPLDCEMDMSEAILDAEGEGVDALLFHVRTIDDAYNLGQNAYMSIAAASILADSEEALETALIYYCGRALVDSRSDVDPGTMGVLAAGYGAIVR